MSRLLTAAALSLALFLLPAAPSPAHAQEPDQDQDYVDMPLATLIETAPTHHPAALYVLAARLMGEGRMQEAANWMYAAQLRYRFLLMAQKAEPGSAEAVLFSALVEQVGRPVNEYIGGNIDEWLATIDWALDWDATHPNSTTSKTQYAAELAEVRKGMDDLRAKIDTERASIARQRAAAGLPNR